MRYSILILVYLFSETVLSCPFLAGQYSCSFDHPRGQTFRDIEIHQKNGPLGESYTTNVDLMSDDQELLLADGKAYVIEQNEQFQFIQMKSIKCSSSESLVVTTVAMMGTNLGLSSVVNLNKKNKPIHGSISQRYTKDGKQVKTETFSYECRKK